MVAQQLAAGFVINYADVMPGFLFGNGLLQF